jgi:hypothetical protein
MGEQLVYDSRRFRVLAFGGAYDYSGAPADDVLSIIAGGVMTDVRRSGAWPLARAGHAMAYDPARDLVVVFGGADASRHLLFSDTWLFDGTRWQTGPVGPPARQDATMAWDPERRVVVLAGGRDDQQRPLSDVWEFDGLAWTPRGSIPPRSSAGLAWHPVERRWFWVGGAMDAGTFGQPIWSTDTFVSLDDGGWDKVVAPPVSPAAPVTVGAAQTLTSVQFAYDLDVGRGFAFAGGGVTDSCGYSGCTHSDYFGNDLFTWSTEPTNAFQPVIVSGPKPPPRADGAFVWSPEHGLVLVGGQAGTTNYGDTWRFADGGWENLDASVPERISALLAWDDSRRRLVLHGGVTPDGGLSAETFELVDAGWQLVSTAGPVAGPGAAMTWDPVIGGLVLVAPGAQGLSTWVQGGWSSESALGPLGTGAQNVNWVQARSELHVGTDNSWQSFVRVRHAGVWQTRDGVRGRLFEHAPGVLAAPSIRAVSVFDARSVRPSIEVSVDVPPVVASGELWSVTARTLAGAQGILDGGVTLGTTLETFLNGVYSEPRVNSAPLSHSAEIEWSTTDPQQLAELRRLQGVVRMRLKPRGFNEFETSVVRLDDVEFRWGFRVTEGRDGG